MDARGKFGRRRLCLLLGEKKKSANNFPSKEDGSKWVARKSGVKKEENKNRGKIKRIEEARKIR